MLTGRNAALSISITTIAISMVLFCAGCMSVSIPAKEDAGQEQNTAALQSGLQENIAHVKENASSLASTIHRLINEERKNNRLDSLQWDQELASIALSHSGDMAERNYFDHYSPEGKDFADRYKEHGYSKETHVGNQVYVGGENLFLNNVVDSYTYDQETGEVHEYSFSSMDELASSTVEGWMESPGHRENILDPFSREGIGVVVTDEGKVYITENFS